MNSYEAFKSSLEADEIVFQDHDGYLSLGWEAEPVSYWEHVYVRQMAPALDGEKIELAAIPDTRIEKDSVGRVSALFSHMNWQISMGNWDINPEQGDIRFRLAFVAAGPLTPEIARFLLRLCGAEVERAMEAILSVAYGDAPIEQALEKWVQSLD